MTLAQLAIFAIETIQAIATAVREANEGKVTPEQAHARIVNLQRELVANDAAADAALKKKFSQEE